MLLLAGNRRGTDERKSHKSPKKVDICDFFGSLFFKVFLHKIKFLIYFSTSCKLCLAHLLFLRSKKVRKKSGQTVPYTQLSTNTQL
jgi:hypothetical protein